MNENAGTPPLSRVIATWTAERWVAELRSKVARSWEPEPDEDSLDPCVRRD